MAETQTGDMFCTDCGLNLHGHGYWLGAGLYCERCYRVRIAVDPTPPQLPPSIIPTVGALEGGPMTPERIAEMDERCKKATPGEWSTRWVQRSRRVEPGSTRKWFVIGGDEDLALILQWSDRVDAADATFIAHARTDLPEAIEEIKRLNRVQDEEVTEFNAGHDCAEAGGSIDDMPGDVPHDQWGCGFAWGAFDRMTAEIKRLQESHPSGDEIYAKFLEWREIYTEQGDKPCKLCGGTGARAYPSTATWVGGIGGQAVTGGVCDKCWGSGNADKPWANLRVIRSRLAELQRKVEELEKGEQA